MEHNSGFYAYLLIRLPLILTFASGYLVYLLLATTKLTEAFVWWSLRQSHGNFKCLLAYVMGSAVLLSFFIPNAVTVLALLPFLKTIEQDMASQNDGGQWTTPLTLSVIYGANIGGMGSLIGSPANLLLIGALDLYGVPGREQISFLNWFIWSVPLAISFSAIAWVLIATWGVSKKTPVVAVRTGGIERRDRALSSEQKCGGALVLFFLFFWIVEGIFKELVPPFSRFEPYVCMVFFLLFVYLAFVKPRGEKSLPLLRFRHVVTCLPKRGLLFLCFVALIFPVIRLFELDQHAARWFSGLMGPNTPVFLVFFGTTLGVILLTEVLSNTVVAAAFFPVVYFTSSAYGLSPMILMIAVSIASTCAFMTPIATPCNALAFGEMKRTSLKKMLILGLPLNVMGALLLTFWLQWVIPLVYS